MKSVSRLTLVVAVILMSIMIASPAMAQTPVPPVGQQQPQVLPPNPQYPVIGYHTVQYGEWLYCIGRAYAVSPWEIAKANYIPWPYAIYPGQVLAIPSAAWYNIPAGPKCNAQFTPPVWPTVTPAPPTAVPPTVGPWPTIVPPPPGCRAYYTVQWGDTLYGIAWRYNTTVWALAQANNIWNINLIYPGQVLCIK